MPLLQARQAIKILLVLTISFVAFQFDDVRAGWKRLCKAGSVEVKQESFFRRNATAAPDDPWKAAFELAQQRFASRAVLHLNISYSDLKQKQKETFQQQSSAVLNSIRIPKAGSSHLSVIARALAGCHPDGYPCCKGVGSPPGSCPRPDLFCPVVTGCTDHRPNFAGDEPVITVFRHPSSRLLSSFFYVQPHRPGPISDHRWSTFETFVTNVKYRNVMTKMLSTGDYAYSKYTAGHHTVKRAKQRLCNETAWFGVNEWPLLSVMLLYEMPAFSQLVPNPVLFGLPPADQAVATMNKNTTTNNSESQDGLRENNNQEYATFRSKLFVERNGSDLVLEHNAEDVELYQFACALFCARVQQSGLFDAARAIAAEEINNCIQVLGGNRTVDSLCQAV